MWEATGNDDDRRGAAICLERTRECLLNPTVLEGGDTLNGKGSPTDDYAVNFWRFTASFNPGVNFTAGFPGPGSTRTIGANVLNRTNTP